MEPSKNDIIGGLAKDRVVERLVENITRRPLDALTSDLAQTVYVYLLEYRDEVIQDLWRCDQLVYFVARIVWNQWNGSRSTFRAQLRSFSARSVDITDKDFPG